MDAIVKETERNAMPKSRMIKLRVLPILAVIFTLIGPTAQAAASLEKCNETLGKFRQLGNVPELLAQSYGYAVLPTIGKGGLMYEASIGGQKFKFKPLGD